MPSEEDKAAEDEELNEKEVEEEEEEEKKKPKKAGRSKRVKIAAPDEMEPVEAENGELLGDDATDTTARKPSFLSRCCGRLGNCMSGMASCSRTALCGLVAAMKRLVLPAAVMLLYCGALYGSAEYLVAPAAAEQLPNFSARLSYLVRACVWTMIPCGLGSDDSVLKPQKFLYFQRFSAPKSRR